MDVRAFYDDLADEYDAIYADWEASVRRQSSVLSPLVCDEPILDVAAGMGTQALALALAGRRVLARDLSPKLVERGRREAERMGLQLLGYETGDMRHAREHARFGTVIAFDNALPHLLDDADVLAALTAAKTALRPGGCFLASIRDYDALGRERPALDPPRLLGEPPTRRLVLQVWTWAIDGRRYDLDHLILREERGWSARVRRTRYRMLLRSELEAVARSAGFSELAWLEPSQTGFYQPIFRAKSGG